jgi:hypothetical protein
VQEKTVVEAQVDKVVMVLNSFITRRRQKFNKRIRKESYKKQLLLFLINPGGSRGKRGRDGYSGIA